MAGTSLPKLPAANSGCKKKIHIYTYICTFIYTRICIYIRISIRAEGQGSALRATGLWDQPWALSGQRGGDGWALIELCFPPYSL